MEWYIITIFCIIITFIVSYYIPKGKIKKANEELDKQEQEKRLQIKDLETEYQKTLNQIQQDKNNWELEKNRSKTQLIQEQQNLQLEVRGLQEQKKEILNTLEIEAKESGRIFKEQQIQIAEEQIEKAKLEMFSEYSQASEQAKENYLQLLEDSVKDFNKNTELAEQSYQEMFNKLKEYSEKVSAAVQASKRSELDKQQKNFYRLQLSDVDIEEIKRIRSIEPYLRNKEPLNKVIWKVYYEKPYTDLIGRVVGTGRKIGIYKITNLENEMCYVGQSNDIASRWKQHIKRGVGAETPTRNKLYPAMLEIGVENFTFEIIEECDAKDLNEREDFWQQYFHSIEFGYSIK